MCIENHWMCFFIYLFTVYAHTKCNTHAIESRLCEGFALFERKINFYFMSFLIVCELVSGPMVWPRYNFFIIWIFEIPMKVYCMQEMSLTHIPQIEHWKGKKNKYCSDDILIIGLVKSDWGKKVIKSTLACESTINVQHAFVGRFFILVVWSFFFFLSSFSLIKRWRATWNFSFVCKKKKCVYIMWWVYMSKWNRERECACTDD